MMDTGMGFGGHGGFAFLGPLFIILVLAVAGYAAYYLYKRRGGEEMKNTDILIIAAVALLFLALFSGGVMGFGMGFGLLFWIAVLAVLYYLITGSRGSANEESPLEILDKRFARGEISREEYLEMKKEILDT